jgi:hypothetical protein
MRFADRLTFVSDKDSYYDPTLGQYVDGETVKDVQPCHLSSLGTERTVQLFGNLDKGVTVARLQRPYKKEFDHVLINEQKFLVQKQSNYKKGVLYLEEAASDG